MMTRFWWQKLKQFFTAQAQPEAISLISTDVVAPEQPEGCAREEAVMPGGFGQAQPQRRSGKTALQEIRQLSVALQPSSAPEPDVDLAMQAEIEAFFAQ